ncbi:hypothetical protein [Marinobacterium mangrovicola]|uniref:Uncharacterized protein n=1 Tax=Marinobacterium mangrovicola TaxID=1476959 RepID=A0A4R1GEE8_9GAMM|nr:hypothetical protein [Marinobacterium mangrovicola]TCK04129.1 hypothetical protein CLV83_3544 [Marinobacterium mangrovicola]
MKRTILTLAISTTLFAQAEAAEHRLAFSKAAELEIFVEHPDNQPWCSESLSLRFQGNGATNSKTVTDIMPKLGVLIGRECPQATDANWQSVNPTNESIAEGSANAADQWQLNIATGYGVTPKQQTTNQPADAIASTEPASPNASSEPAVPASPQNVPAVRDDSTQQQAVAEKIQPEQLSSGSEDVADVRAEKDETTPPTPENQAGHVAETEDEPAQKQKAIQAESQKPSFAINGWQPRSSIETIKETSFSLPIKDQNNCIFNTNYDLKVDAEFIRGTSSNLTCNPLGLIEGEGSFHISRTDGQNLGTIEAEFSYGLPFIGGKPKFEIQKITGRNLYAHIGSDESAKVHYLLEIPRANNGAWNLKRANLLALTENEALFRDVKLIDPLVRQGIDLMPKPTSIETRRVSFVALTSIAEALKGETVSSDHLLYSVRLSRKRNSPLWSFNLQQAKNHLFEREYREAQAAKREQERLEREERLAKERAHQQKIRKLQELARTEQNNLQHYEEIAKRPPQELRNSWVHETDYDFLDRSEYTRLVQGAEREWRQIVHIDGEDDGIWQIDFPYHAQLNSDQQLSNGWYQVTGMVSLDAKRADSDGLPLTRITASQTKPCNDRQCLENFDPVSVMQAQLNDLEWTPLKAQATIDKLNSGELD